MKKSKVSVIVPVYNVEKYVGICLDSLLKQTLKDIEIICVNDGSTDGSLEILEEYRKKDSRIIVVNQQNGGRSIARNKGLKKVSSPYVMFCDSDDKYDLTMCEKMVKALEEYETDLAVCGITTEYEAHSEIKNSDEAYYRLKFYGKNYIDENIIRKTDASVCNKIFRMDLIQKFKIDFPEKLNNEDYYFYNAYMSVAKTCYYLNRKLYKYIRHEGSIMSEFFDKDLYSPDHLLIAEKLFKFYKENGFLERHKDLAWAQFVESFWFSYNHSARKYHKKIMVLGKDFINQYYDKYKPLNRKVENSVREIAYYNLFYKIKKRTKLLLKNFYLKVNYGYRQQNYINVFLDDAYEKFVDLSDRLDGLKKEK